MEEKRTKVIYHSVDLDGVASAAIARVALEREGIYPELAPYNYGQPMPVVTNADRVYMLDVSLGPTTVEVLNQWVGNGIDVTWIDHHKTVMEYEGQDSIPGIRKVGEAACSLTWKHFNPGVPVPLYIDLLAAYDIWDHETYDWLKVMYYQYGMRARVGLSVAGMANLIRRMAKETRIGKAMDFVMDTTSNGEAILHYIARKNAGELDRFAFTATVSGYRALCMNTTEFNSTTFDSMWDENELDLMMPFCWDGSGGFCRCSLYTTKDGVDCAAIARSFGGGGHAKAAGFQLALGDFTQFLDFKRL